MRATGIPSVIADSPARWSVEHGIVRTGVFHMLVHPLRGASGTVDGLLTVATPLERTD